MKMLPVSPILSARARRWRRWGLSAVVLLAGCDEDSTTDPEPRNSLSKSRADTPTRGRLIGAERVDRTVDWPTPEDFGAASAAALARMDDASLARLSDSPAPVLWPTETLPLEPRPLLVGETWWSVDLVGRDDWEGVTVHLHASSRAKLHPELIAKEGIARPRDLLRGIPATLSQNEGIRTASWIERGVAFGLDIECARQDHHACSDPDSLARVGQGLVFVPSGEGAPP